MDERIRARLGLPIPDPDRPRKDLRVFGFGLAVILLVFATLSWRKGGAAWPYELPLATACALLGTLRPEALRPVYGPWMKAVGVIGRINTWLVMALVYYLVITPYAALARLVGGDLLDEGLRDRESYWHARGELPAPESYRNQF
ncbi:MAG: SxtJ family membrane protein [Elusimicrobia bacterium]|nr:SxtJ family membrane protein [Elusimicrobiota bacterium]